MIRKNARPDWVPRAVLCLGSMGSLSSSSLLVVAVLAAFACSSTDPEEAGHGALTGGSGPDASGGARRDASGVGGAHGGAASGAGGADAASGGHLPAAGFTGVATYEDWLAQDCDCTPERPCPMFCDGITVVDEFSIIAPQTLEAQPMCEFEIDPNAACPPFLQYHCGVVRYFDRFPPPERTFFGGAIRVQAPIRARNVPTTRVGSVREQHDGVDGVRRCACGRSSRWV